MIKLYALLIIAFTIASCSEEKIETKEVAKPVKAITLNNTQNENKLMFPGKVFAAKEANITFKVSGKLQSLPVKEGQEIKKGQLIARLDQKDFKFAYEKALADFKESESSFARAQELIKNRYISQADFDLKKKAFEIAKAELNIAQTNLNYTTLRAPFDGTVAKVYPDNYQNVQVKEDIIILQNLENLDVKLFLPERIAIQKYNVKSIKIFVRFDANPNKSYEATIYETSTQADQQTQTYETTVRLPRPNDINVLPGMTAIVEAQVRLNDDNGSGYVIPADALLSDNDKNSFVWVINAESRLEKRQIQAASFAQDSVKIQSGLESGDVVVIAGVDFLRENQLVSIYTK